MDTVYRSRLSCFCSKIIEFCCLTAAIVCPLFFNIYSARIFEPDKAMLLNAIVWIMVVAGIIAQLEEGGARGKIVFFFMKKPLAWPMLLLLASWLISTFFSLTPIDSFWGGYYRGQGLYTLLCYLLIYFFIACTIRSRLQIENLIQVIILTSLPVCLFAIGQHMGLDPLPWGEDVTERASSSAGNPIFLGSYLIIVFFLTVVFFIRSLLSLAAAPKYFIIVLLSVICYGVIGIIQLLALLYSGSRGPILGWMSGCFFFILMLLILLKKRSINVEPDGSWIRGETQLENRSNLSGSCNGYCKWKRSGLVQWLWFIWIGIMLISVAFLAEINRPDSPLASFREMPYVGRLGVVYEQLADGTGTSSVRLHIWQGMAALIKDAEPVVAPDLVADKYAIVRPFIGHGPESMHALFGKYYHPDLGMLESYAKTADRSHNQTLDTLVTTGILGLFAQQIFLLSLFVLVFKKLGFLGGRIRTGLFVSLWMFFGLAGGLLFTALFGDGFIGIGIPVGIVGAIFLYLVYLGFSNKNTTYPAKLDLQESVFVIGILAALLANYIESQVGINTVSTCFLFYCLSGVLAAFFTCRMEPAARQGQIESSASLFTVLTVVTVTILFAILHNFGNATTLFSILADFFTSLPLERQPGSVMAVSLILLSWCGIIVTWLTGIPASNLSLCFGEGKKRLLMVFSGAAVIASSFAVSMAFLFQKAVTFHPETVNGFLQATEYTTGTVTVYFLFLFLVIVIASLVCSSCLSDRSLSLPLSKGVAALFFLPLLFSAGFVVYKYNLAHLRADALCKQAAIYGREKQYDQATILNRRTVGLVPYRDIYYAFWGQSLLAGAGQTNQTKGGLPSLLTEESTIEDLMGLSNRLLSGLSIQDRFIAARIALEKARQLNPRASDNYANLARYYQARTTVSVGAAERDKWADMTLQYYEKAVSLTPSNASLINQWGMACFLLKKDSQTALLKLNHSLDISPGYHETYKAFGYINMVEKKWSAATDAYNRALELSPHDLDTKKMLVDLYQQKNDPEKSIELLREIVAESKDWLAGRNLAFLLKQQGKPAEAVKVARAALQEAPINRQDELRRLILEYCDTSK